MNPLVRLRMKVANLGELVADFYGQLQELQDENAQLREALAENHAAEEPEKS